MSFLYPFGLLGLIGIPILIIIYIIKSKYTEQTVASTYLWTLSEKFLKRKNPISKLTGIISLILQLLAITLISLGIAHPIVRMPDMAKEYCFILDASGSMNMSKDGVTRFERGKNAIASLIEESVEGSVYSLITVGDTTTVVFEKLSNKEQAVLLLQETAPAYNEAEYADALGVAQGYFDENNGLKSYLVTDTSYHVHDNLEIVNVADGEENYAVSNVTYKTVDDRLTVSGVVTSYESDAALTVGLVLDGENAARAEQTINAAAGVKEPFELTCSAEKFSSLKVVLAGEDALALDNEYVIYDTTGESSYDTLIVSDTPFFLKSVLGALINATVEVVAPEEYTPASGYGLYVFDSFTPEDLPSDGAVWLINPQASVDEAGFSVQEEVELEKADILSVSTSSSSTVKNLTADTIGEEIYISDYVKCGLYRSFSTVYSYQGNPVIFAGTNEYGNREVVLAFDLHTSNFPVLVDYIVLMRNFIEYSFPAVLEKTDHYCGDTVDVNVLANCKSIRVDTPTGGVTYLDASSAVSKLQLTEVGVYTITMFVGETQRSFYLYSAMLEQERVPTVEEEGISLQGTASEGGFDGIYDTMMLLFILLAVVFLADWGVYCYEKHQLR